MSNLQNRSVDPHGLVRHLISRSTESRLAESPPSQVAAVTAELKDALAREAALLREKDEILRRQAMLTQKFERRLANSLQLIVSLLSLQSSDTESPEAAAQLPIAARRVGAFGRVHHQLHHLDLLDTHCLSVTNGGPSLPGGFNPGSSKGLGLRIVNRSSGGSTAGLRSAGPGQDGGACFKLFFPSAAAVRLSMPSGRID